MNDPRAIGHKSADTPTGHEPNGAVAGEGANFILILLHDTFGFHHKFGEFSLILLTLLVFSLLLVYIF